MLSLRIALKEDLQSSSAELVYGQVLNKNKNLVEDIGGRPETVSIDRIKPAHVEVFRPLELAHAPWRGHPPIIDWVRVWI